MLAFVPVTVRLPAVGTHVLADVGNGLYLEADFDGTDFLVASGNTHGLVKLDPSRWLEMSRSDYMEFESIPRLYRDCTISEKIDGMNVQILIHADTTIEVGSRECWLSMDRDTAGVLAWVLERKTEIVAGLGPGRHYGEFFGKNIGRRYGLDEHRLALFNTRRWCRHGDVPLRIGGTDTNPKFQERPPSCLDVVPVLYRGPFNDAAVSDSMEILRSTGSVAVPGFKRPEGVVIYHDAAEHYFKTTFDGDKSKWQVRKQ